VVGDGPDRARYEGQAGSRAIFLGALPHAEAIAALRACDIAYSDCWSDAGFPAKIFEYMALGLPIVAPRKPQLGEVLTDGHDACLYSTPEELAGVLRDLARDPGRREELGRRARATFLGSHTSALRGRELAAILLGRSSA
jgi:glycosyltransferase involved in cell wall biosynthesis